MNTFSLVSTLSTLSYFLSGGGGAARERRAAKKAAATSSAGGGGGGGGAGLLGGLSPERTTVSDVQDITNAYAAIDAGTVKEQKPQPIW